MASIAELQSKYPAYRWGGGQATGRSLEQNFLASLRADVAKVTFTDRTPGGMFSRSFHGVAASGNVGQVRNVAYRNAGFLGRSRVAGKVVGIDLDIRADPRMQSVIRKLPRLNKKVKAGIVRVIKRVAHQEVVVKLKPEIPKSAARKNLTRVSRDVKIDRRVRGRRGGQRYGKVVHIRSTAKVDRYPLKGGRLGVKIVVGNSDLWYGAALHSKVPFFPRVIEKTWPAFNARMNREMGDVLDTLRTAKVI